MILSLVEADLMGTTYWLDVKWIRLKKWDKIEKLLVDGNKLKT